MAVIIFTFILGILIAGAGLMIWKKERIDMLQPHFHRNVTEVKEYTAAFGKTLLFMGSLIILSGIMALVPIPSWISSTILYAGIVISIVMLLVVQHKYNGTIVSK